MAAAAQPAVLPATCPKCDGYGFTGAKHAIVDNGILMVIALRDGVACSCRWGGEFAGWQLEALGGWA